MMVTRVRVVQPEGFRAIAKNAKGRLRRFLREMFLQDRLDNLLKKLATDVDD